MLEEGFSEEHEMRKRLFGTTLAQNDQIYLKKKGYWKMKLYIHRKAWPVLSFQISNNNLKFVECSATSEKHVNVYSLLKGLSINPFL